MRTVFLLMLVAASFARADSFASASCTFGSYKQSEVLTGNLGENYINATCEIPAYGSDGHEHGVVGAQGITGASISGTQGKLDGDTKVYAQFDQFFPSSWSVEGSMSNTLTLDTGGPERAGFIQFNFQTFNPFAGAGTLLISDAKYQYNVQSVGVTTLPFELGSGFQISISATSSIGDSSAQPSSIPTVAYGAAHATFSLLEADGVTAVPLFVTPEPSTYALLLLGFCAAGLANTIKGSRA